jgi:3-hydroxyisobutyrate dehydrogenase-like beta-hydroxyacid dehydrogenase
MKKLAVIGLGNMGGNMASVLLNKGYEVYVYDIDKEKQISITARGGISLGSEEEAAVMADTIILSLPNDDVMKSVAEKLLVSEFKGKTIIDTTSAKYTTTVYIAKRAEDMGINFIDAPVTGGEKGAKEGTLTFMVGGSDSAFEGIRDVLEAMGTKIVHIGPSGHGQIAKMVNQDIMAAIYASVAEAFAFASERGADIKQIYEAIETGGAQSGLLSGMRETILSGEPVINNNLAIHAKDVDYVMEESNRLKSFMPVNASVQQVMNMARKKGLSDHWSGSMYVMWEEMLGMKLNSTVK